MSVSRRRWWITRIQSKQRLLTAKGQDAKQEMPCQDQLAILLPYDPMKGFGPVYREHAASLLMRQATPKHQMQELKDKTWTWASSRRMMLRASSLGS